MAESMSVSIEGLDEVLAKLETVSHDVRYKGGRFAMRKAANLIRDRAKANAARLDDPKTPTNIAENIAVRFSPRAFRQRGELQFRIGVRGGAKGYAAASGEFKGAGKGNPGGDTFYWRFLEFGTQNMPAQPFMRRALAENIQAATDEFITHYDKALDRALRRAARQAGGS